MSIPVTVTAFDNMSDAERAITQLIEGGVPASTLSIVGKDMQSENQVHGFVTSCDVAKQTAVGASWFGGLFGVLTGAALVWIPGAGPLVVAGTLTSTLLAGIEGAVSAAAVGGVLGWLGALGIEKEHILKFENHLKAGRYLVVVNGSVENLETADAILSQTENAGLHLHDAKAA